MRRVLLFALIIGGGLAAAPAASAVDHTSDIVRHNVVTFHDLNVCGNPATFTLDVNSRLHIVFAPDASNPTRVVFTLSQSYKYSLTFDDPTLGTWDGHWAETIVDVENNGGTFAHDNLAAREGPLQITEHFRYRADPDGNVLVETSYDRVVGC